MGTTPRSSQPSTAFNSREFAAFHLSAVIHWRNADVLSIMGTTQSSLGRASLKLVTYNIWFESRDMSTRVKGLIAMMKREQPDVMCFQARRPAAKLLLLLAVLLALLDVVAC